MLEEVQEVKKRLLKDKVEHNYVDRSGKKDVEASGCLGCCLGLQTCD